MKATSKSGYGSGWHKQSLRHSNARRIGHAGGVYARAVVRRFGSKYQVYAPSPTSSDGYIPQGQLHSTAQEALKDARNFDSVVELPIYQIDGKKYYRDVRLGEYRNVKDPSDKLDINIPNSMLEKPFVKGESFPTGLIKSKDSVLMPKDDSKHFYFVSDFWTTTRYPKTPAGLRSAKAHVAENKKLWKEAKRRD
jgi:hypothetical protein